MSRSVDERVVKMQFDNANFEKNCSQTMSTLDKFRQKLDFTGAEKGLQQLENATRNTSFSGLTNGIEQVSVKFDAMAVVGIRALQRITDAAMSAGSNLVKSLSVDQITSGFNKYEEKTKAVQTIMFATGDSIDVVNKQLEKLNWFTDETSYNFTDMVANIGKFTSNQIPLDTAVTAMMGIANWAAAAGQGTNEASRAMYNLSQAIGVGSVKLTDWMSIENANMATAEFKQQAIDTAVELGTLKQVSDGVWQTLSGGKVTLASFREELTGSGWLNTDVLLGTLKKYGDFTEDVYKVATEEGLLCAEAMEKLSGETMTLGEKAFRAAQEAKTFTDALEATKDAVSSQWSQTFEIIFGNYEEAKVLWTDLANFLWDVFASGGEARNRWLQDFKDLGGISEIIGTLQDLLERITPVIETFKEAFSEIFPAPTAAAIKDAVDQIRSFVDQFQLSEEALMTLKVAFMGLLTPLNMILSTVQAGIKIFAALTLEVFKMADAFLAAFAKGNPIEDFFRNLFGEERYERAIKAITKIINNLSEAFDLLSTYVKEAFDSFDISGEIPEGLQVLLDVLSAIGDVLLELVVVGLEALADVDLKPIIEFGKDQLTTLNNNLKDASKYLDPVVEGLKKFRENIKPAVENIKEFINKLKDMTLLEKVEAIFDKLKEGFEWIVETISGLDLSEIFGNFTANWGDFGQVLKDIADAISRVTERLTPAKILIFAFGGAMVMVMLALNNLITSATKLTDKVTSSVGSTADALKKFLEVKPNTLEKVGIAIAIVAAAVALLATMDIQKVWSSVGAIGVLAVILTGVTALLNKMAKNATPEQVKNINQLGKSLIAFAVALDLCAAALVILNYVDLDGLGWKVLALGGVILELAAAFILISTFAKKDVSKSSMLIISMAAAIVLMAKGLQELSSIPIEGIKQALGTMLLIIGELALVALAVRKTTFSASQAVGLLILVGVLVAMGYALEYLRRFNVSEMLNVVPQFAIIVGALGAVMLATRLAGKNAAGAGVAAILIGAALLIVVQAVEQLGNMNQGVLDRGTSAVNGLMILFALIIAASKLAGEHAQKAGVAFIAMSIAILLLTMSIDAIGHMDPEVAAQGTLVVSILLALFAGVMIAGGMAKKCQGSIIAMTVAVGMLVACIAVLSLLETDEALVSAGALAAVLIAFGVAIHLIEGEDWKGVVAQVVAMALVVAELTACLMLLAEKPWDRMLAGAVSLGGVMLALAAAMRIIAGGEYNMDWKQVGVMLTEILAIVALAAGGLSVLNYFTDEGDNLIVAAGAMAAIMLSLAASIRIMGGMDVKMGVDKAALLVTFVATAVLALMALDPIDGENALANAIALAAMLLAMSVAVTIMSNIKFEKLNKDYIKNLAVLILIMGAVGGVVVALNLLVSTEGFPNVVDNIGTVVAMLGEMVLLVAAASAFAIAFNAVGSVISIGSLAKGIGAFLAVCAAVGLIIGGIGWVVNEFDVNSDVLTRGVEVVGQIGEAIGGFIGGIVGGIVGGVGEALASSLEKIGTSLSNFATNAKDFFDLCKNVDTSDFNWFGDFIGILLKLADSRLLVFPNVAQSVGPALANFGPHMKTFIHSVDEFTDDRLNAVANVAEAIALMANAVKGDLFLNSTMVGYGKALEEFGPHFAKFAESIATIPADTLDKVTTIADSLFELDSKIPDVNGPLSAFIVGTDWTTFSTGLYQFAQAIAAYARIVKEAPLDNDMVEKSINVGTMLAELENKLRGHGGVLQEFFGDADLESFGEQLATFATAMCRYSSIVSGKGDPYGKAGAAALPAIDGEAIEQSANAAQLLVDLENNLRGHEGIFQSLFGDADLDSFGQDLITFGNALAEYSNVVKNGKDGMGGIDIASIMISVEAAKMLINLETLLKEHGGFLSTAVFGDATLETFGKSLESFGNSLDIFYQCIAGKDWNQVTIGLDALQKLLDMVPDMKLFTQEVVDEFNRAMVSLAQNAVKQFIGYFQEEQPNMIAEVNKVMSNVAKGIESTNKTKYAKLGQDIGKSICDAFKKAMTSGLEAVKKEMQAKMTEMEKLASNMAKKIVDTFTKQFNGIDKKMQKIGQSMISGLQKGLANYGAKLVKFLKEFVKKKVLKPITDELKVEDELSRKMYDIGIYMLDGLAYGLYEYGEQYFKLFIKKFVQEYLLHPFYDELAIPYPGGGPSDTMAQIAEYMCQGLIKGIENGKGEVVQAARAMAKDIVDAIKNELQIASPSKVMRDEVGRYIVEGIAAGISASTAAEEAAEQMADNIVNAFQETIDKRTKRTDYYASAFDLWSNTQGSMESITTQIENKDRLLRYQMTNLRETIADELVEIAVLTELFGIESDAVADASQSLIDHQQELFELASELANINELWLEKIDEAYENISGTIERQQSKADLEYNLWSATYGLVATPVQRAEEDLQYSISQMKGLWDKWQAAQAYYNLVVEKFGEDSAESFEAWQAMKNAEIEMANQAATIYDKQITLSEEMQAKAEAAAAAEDAAMAARMAAMEAWVTDSEKILTLQKNILTQSDELWNYTTGWGANAATINEHNKEVSEKQLQYSAREYQLALEKEKYYEKLMQESIDAGDYEKAEEYRRLYAEQQATRMSKQTSVLKTIATTIENNKKGAEDIAAVMKEASKAYYAVYTDKDLLSRIAKEAKGDKERERELLEEFARMDAEDVLSRAGIKIGDDVITGLTYEDMMTYFAGRQTGYDENWWLSTYFGKMPTPEEMLNDLVSKLPEIDMAEIVSEKVKEDTDDEAARAEGILNIFEGFATSDAVAMAGHDTAETFMQALLDNLGSKDKNQAILDIFNSYMPDASKLTYTLGPIVFEVDDNTSIALDATMSDISGYMGDSLEYDLGEADYGGLSGSMGSAAYNGISSGLSGSSSQIDDMVSGYGSSYGSTMADSFEESFWEEIGDSFGSDEYLDKQGGGHFLDLGVKGDYDFKHSFAGSAYGIIQSANDVYDYITGKGSDAMVTGITSAVGKMGPLLNKLGIGGSDSYMDGITGSKGFDINSPSKKMIYVGECLVEGLSKGIDKRIDSSVNALLDPMFDAMGELSGSSNAMYQIGQAIYERLSNAVTGPNGESLLENIIAGDSNRVSLQMQYIVNTINGILDSELDHEPVITPVLDLTNVRSGVAEIQDMMKAVQSNAAMANYTSATRENYRNQNGVSSKAKAEERPVTVSFVQNNNSPKSLSTLDIYRQTRNALAQFKEAVESE